MHFTCVLFLVAACSCVLFWDVRPPKGLQVKEDEKGVKNPMGIPNTFKHLDLTWKPMLKASDIKSLDSSSFKSGGVGSMHSSS
jgi:hypothetical protein